MKTTLGPTNDTSLRALRRGESNEHILHRNKYELQARHKGKTITPSSIPRKPSKHAKIKALITENNKGSEKPKTKHAQLHTTEKK